MSFPYSKWTFLGKKKLIDRILVVKWNLISWLENVVFFISFHIFFYGLLFFFSSFFSNSDTLYHSMYNMHTMNRDKICVWDRYLWPSLTQDHSTENRRHCTNKLVREMNLHSIAPTVDSLVDKAVANLSPAPLRYLSPDSNQDFKGIFSAEHLLIWKFVATQPFFI